MYWTVFYFVLHFSLCTAVAEWQELHEDNAITLTSEMQYSTVPSRQNVWPMLSFHAMHICLSDSVPTSSLHFLSTIYYTYITYGLCSSLPLLLGCITITQFNNECGMVDVKFRRSEMPIPRPGTVSRRKRRWTTKRKIETLQLQRACSQFQLEEKLEIKPFKLSGRYEIYLYVRPWWCALFGFPPMRSLQEVLCNIRYCGPQTLVT